MSLQYIIDAYNMINHPEFSRSAKGSSGPAVSLVEFIRRNKLTGSRKNTAVLVFDGYPAAGVRIAAEEGLVCLFSRMIEADEKIKKLVEESGRPQDIVVVSDDRQVQQAARLLRAQTMGVREFICGRKGSGRMACGSREDINEPKISYSGMQKINAELKKRWLDG